MPIGNSTKIIGPGWQPCRPWPKLSTGILACHGTPTNDNQYLVEEALQGRLVRAKATTIQDRLGNVPARLVLCGHSHQQHLIQLPDGLLILNPGSVGCPSYEGFLRGNCGSFGVCR
jgi:predicted phosphodiesterase